MSKNILKDSNNNPIEISKVNIPEITSLSYDSSTGTSISGVLKVDDIKIDGKPSVTKEYVDSNFAHTIVMSLDSSNYKVYISLKDKDGNILGTQQEIDLPLESVVVSGSYDSETKEVVLTLKDGSTIRFSVADLVSGLQSEITSSNKLSSDLVTDSGATNLFVTAADKNAWNAKYDLPSGGITTSDLSSTVVTSLGLADTAVQPNDISDMATKGYVDAGLGTKQTTIDSSNMLSSDLIDDTNKTNKFVTAADIAAWNSKADDNTVMHLTTAESATGLKTFTDGIVTPKISSASDLHLTPASSSAVNIDSPTWIKGTIYPFTSEAYNLGNQSFLFNEVNAITYKFKKEGNLSAPYLTTNGEDLVFHDKYGVDALKVSRNRLYTTGHITTHQTDYSNGTTTWTVKNDQYNEILINSQNGTRIVDMFDTGSGANDIQGMYLGGNLIAPLDDGVLNLGQYKRRFNNLFIKGLNVDVGNKQYCATFTTTNENPILAFNYRNGSYDLPVRRIVIKPGADNALDLATSTLRYKDLYLAGNISDGTNSISVANIQKQITVIDNGDNTIDVIIPTK